MTEPGDADSGDSSSPWISAEYKARSKEETCTTGTEDSRYVLVVHPFTRILVIKKDLILPLQCMGVHGLLPTAS